MTPEKLVEELDRVVQGPGLSQRLGPADPQPHRHARDRHQEPGRREGLGRRASPTIDRVAAQVEADRQGRSGRHLGACRAADRGRYIDVDIDRAAAARYGSTGRRRAGGRLAAIGGENVGETIEGRERYPINVRYPREIRDTLRAPARSCRSSPPAARRSRCRTWRSIEIDDGPPMLKERERAALGLGLRRRARPRPALRGDATSVRGRARRKLPPGDSDRLVGPVRVPGARDRAAEARGPGHAGGHLPPALPDVPARATRPR